MTATRAKIPHRTLKAAIDLVSMTTITSDDLLAMDRLDYLAVRRAAAEARLSGVPRYACARRGHSVYAPMSVRRTPMWKHNYGAPPSCEWWTGDPSTVDRISGLQFAGAQESPLHVRVKGLVAEMLELDPSVAAGSIVVDRYLVGDAGRRRPDVRATVGSRDVAFEIQLSTTQIPIIVAREDFYAREGRALLWLTWSLDTARELPTSFWDIFHSHNRNLFSLDEHVITKSRGERRFLLRAHWMAEGGEWLSDVVSLERLTWSVGKLPFAVGPTLPWHLDFRRRWLELHASGFAPRTEQAVMLDEVAQRIGAEGGQELLEADVADILSFYASAVAGRPVASGQRNLKELVNTFLAPGRRHRLARLARYALARTRRAEVLRHGKVADRLAACLEAEQEARGSPAGRSVLAVFPELFDD